ncbi:MAG: PIG-L family deacetylase [Candidatus Omnitrophica bacterium]|nr:PIG-L family deacetylase [Candidatus Omnitrophota bacterium]
MQGKILLILLSYILLSTVGVVAAAVAAPASQQSADIKPLEPIVKGDRILILAPHPDDEVLGCAGVIQAALKAGAEVRVAFLTNGEHNELAFIVFKKKIPLQQKEFINLGEVRRSESEKSAKLLGLKESDLIFLGYPDFGTFTIFSRYWETDRPYKTILTRISKVPYKNNLSFGAPYVGESILNDLKKVFTSYKPNKIFVSHPADVNGDHRALYLFLKVALLDLAKDGSKPAVYPYLVHCVGWPLPRHYHPELELTPAGKFLESDLDWSSLSLTKDRVENKYKAILMHKSQTASSAFYLLSFIRKNELFSDYPEAQLTSQDISKGDILKFSGFSDLYDGIDDAEEDTSGEQEIKEGQVSFAYSGGDLFIRVDKNKNFTGKFSFVLYLFGYNVKTSFSQMPKIRIFVKNKKIKIYDGIKPVVFEGVLLERKAKVITLKVPLSFLGDPDLVFTSMKAYGGALEVDATGFRMIKIKNGG